MGKLDGKVALITGAGEGIGRATAIFFAKEGAKVAVCDINPVTAGEVQQEIQAIGGEAIAVAADVCTEEGCKKMVDATADFGGSVDILIHCAMATIHDNVPFEAITPEHWNMCINSAVLGTWNLMRFSMPYMREKGWGRIVNFGSSAGIEGRAGQAPYAAAKEGLRALTRVGAREWAKDGITCNAICPSAYTRTVKAWAEANPEAYKAMNKAVPLGRSGDPEKDIAPIVLFLSCDDSQYLTGQTFAADGFRMVLR